MVFSSGAKKVHALRGIDLVLKEGEILAVVGESGCGKSVTGLSILKLHGANATQTGKIYFGAEEISHLTENQMRAYRGKKIAMIFQEPMTALNPVFTVGFQLAEVLSLHRNLAENEINDASVLLLESVGITEARLRLKSYPFQLSGGMRQRVLIAMALAANPQILIADEPTTALDVTIQAQILLLLREIREREKMAMIYITHDLGTVAKLADRVAVMYAGEVVETGTVEEIFEDAKHPYTQALLASVANRTRGEKLFTIPGSPPPLTEIPQGCAFLSRCSYAQPRCHEKIPVKIKDDRMWRCIRS